MKIVCVMACAVWLLGLSNVRVLALPVVSSVEPANGSPGQTVFLSGNDLAGTFRVSFGGVAADFSVESPSRVLAVVPRGALSGPILVESVSGSAFSRNQFLVPPRIDGVRPSRAGPGSTIILDGSNFTGVTNVYLGSTPMKFQITSPGQIFAVLPTNAATAKLAVVASVGFGLSSSPYPIAGPAPIIDSIEPALGPPGSTFLVLGANFEGVTQVQIGSAAAAFNLTAIDQLHVVVPPAAATGPLIVRGSRGSSTSSVPFQVTRSPVIQKFEPQIGRPGTQVVVEGINFTEMTGASFNGKTVTGIASAAPGQILITVPEGATTGPLRVTNRFGTGTSTNAFTVATGPLVLGFEPPFGPPGSLVRVEGMNFSGLSGPLSVRFGSRAATQYTVTADTQLEAMVPPGISDGFIVVSNRFGASTSSAPFLVSGRAPFVTAMEPLTGPGGTLVKITGINLDTATSVRFDGKRASGVEITAPTQLFAYAPPGVTTGPLIISNPLGSSSNRWVFSGMPRIASMTPKAVRAGELVVVRGTNLAGVVSLKLGELELPVLSASSNEFHFAMPEQGVKGKILLETVAGVHASPEAVAILPSVKGIDPAFGPVGSTVVVTGSGFAETTEVLFGDRPGEFVVRALDRLEVRVPQGITNSVVRVKTTDGIGESPIRFVVTGPSDLNISASSTLRLVAPGDFFEWVVKVTNSGPLAVSRVALTNSFPTSIQIESVVTEFEPVVKAVNRVEVYLGLLTNAQTALIRIRASADRSGYFTNTARVFGFEQDPFPLNNVGRAWIGVARDSDLELALRPAAGGGSRVVVSWPQSGLPLELETTADLVPPVLWLPINGSVGTIQGRFVYTNTFLGRERYYRLVLP